MSRTSKAHSRRAMANIMHSNWLEAAGTTSSAAYRLQSGLPHVQPPGRGSCTPLAFRSASHSPNCAPLDVCTPMWLALSRHSTRSADGPRFRTATSTASSSSTTTKSAMPPAMSNGWLLTLIFCCSSTGSGVAGPGSGAPATKASSARHAARAWRSSEGTLQTRSGAEDWTRKETGPTQARKLRGSAMYSWSGSKVSLQSASRHAPPKLRATKLCWESRTTKPRSLRTLPMVGRNNREPLGVGWTTVRQQSATPSVASSTKRRPQPRMPSPFSGVNSPSNVRM
mmetsp:Transcript_39407/g.111606  ORF Transcript_39407/g.111606 Transcript_39407/m.111606 type:complete len:283 (-) Transcript_39407:1544-2392(-)